MEGHRDQAIHRSSGEQARPFFGQEITQRATEGLLAAELEGVNGLPNSVTVDGHRARIDEGGGPPPAGFTAMGFRATGLEAPEGKTAGHAERRTEPFQTVPAAATERIAATFV